ncbi:hypothetical protein IFT48_03345 [Pseudomonas fluorescens]|uniref:hypothetical protein n=1 Tax=Pseudomonas TaxID=286 RepID=UPI000F043CE6|nr:MULTISPECIES: hypothetical protein [Pseudomonas]MBD8089004.1 hypothetical protein [Pseudomonas fluorescens]MBD8681784.1 hypothetical protein [Pseudomonas sp. CFBP 13719]
MTTKKPNLSSQLSKAVENLAEARSSYDPSMVLWHEASQLINAMKIKEAALKAAQACGPDLLEDPMMGMILDDISNLAVTNDISGPEIESMWSTAAEFGRHDLAYNAANEILFRASSVEEYKLADRYFQMAIKGEGPVSLKASAITNATDIVREGYITGKKDWLGAIERYETAAAMGLLKAMFNAGNVLLWLVEAGDGSYGNRAAAWFKKVISIIESNGESIDIGGPSERVELLQAARTRLAQMHLDKAFDGASQAGFDLLAAHHPLDPHMQWLNKKNVYLSLVHSTLKPGKSAADNWESVLKQLGWQIKGRERINYGIVEGMQATGTRLLIEAAKTPLVLLVFDKFAHPDDNLSTLQRSIAMVEANQLQSPVFYVNSKGYFVQHEGHAFSVLQVAHRNKHDVTPIWPGATADLVLKALEGPLDGRFVPGHDDQANTIPRLVNALDENIKLSGKNLPNAIWLRVGEIFCLPIHRGEEPERIGIKSNPREELAKALRG